LLIKPRFDPLRQKCRMIAGPRAKCAAIEDMPGEIDVIARLGIAARCRGLCFIASFKSQSPGPQPASNSIVALPRK